MSLVSTVNVTQKANVLFDQYGCFILFTDIRNAKSILNQVSRVGTFVCISWMSDISPYVNGFFLNTDKHIKHNGVVFLMLKCVLKISIVE